MQCLCSREFRWMLLVTTVVITAVAIVFGRFRSNERVALAVAAGAMRRRDQSAVSAHGQVHTYSRIELTS